MPKPWAAVASSPEYQSLQPAQQQAARQQYFKQVVAPQIQDPAQAQQAWTQFESQAGGQPKQAQRQSAPKPADMAAIARQTYDDSPVWQRPLIAAGAEFTQLGRGLGQLFTPNDSDVNKRLTAAADEDAPYQGGVHGVSGFVGRALPIIASIPLGGPEAAALKYAPQVGRLARLAIKAATAAAEGGAYAGASEVRTGGSRVGQAGLGALFGTGARGVAGGVAKAGHVIKGQWVDPAMQSANKYLTSQGIPVTLGDLGSNASRFIENRLKPLFGSGRTEVLEKQAGGVIREADGLANDFTNQRRWIAAAAGVPDASPEQLVADGIKRQYTANKKTAGAKYDAVSDKAKGAPSVEASGTQSALQEIAAEAPEALRGFTTTNATVVDWLKTGGKARLSFDELRELRSEVSNSANAAGRRVTMGNADKATQNEAKFLGRVVSAIESDMDGWATKTGGDVLSSYREANKYFRENVAPYRNQPETKPYIKPDANPDNIGGKLAANKPETAARMVGATDQTGQAAAAELFVRRAVDKATDPARESAISTFRLLKGLDAGKSADAIFTPGEQAAIARVGGFAKLLSRASSAAADPMTGQMLASGGLAALAGGTGAATGDNKLVGAGVGVLAALAAPRAANRATQSEMLKRLIFSGLPKDVAESVAIKMSRLAAQRGITAGGVGNTRPPLELDVVGGRVATPAQIAADAALVGRR